MAPSRVFFTFFRLFFPFSGFSSRFPPLFLSQIEAVYSINRAKTGHFSGNCTPGDGIPLPDFGVSQLLAGSSRVWLKGLRLKLRQERNICSRQTAKHLKLRQERHIPLLTELEPIPVAQLQ
jgi:hypothetical protein